MGLLLLSAGFACARGGGISFDGSLGPAATLTGPNYTIPANMGTQVGGNLFHSFGQFNLLSGETADFTATGSTGPISNIIARVTGGSASSIDGTIESSVAGANLFLLNPSGVIFGPDAKVNVTGAFTVGTPDYIKLADGTGIFHTSLGGNDVLTAASVSAFGFLGNAPAAVQFSQSNLSFAMGSNFTVISGDITLDGATLTAPAGNVSFFSAKSAGELPFDPATPGASFGASTVGSLGNVTLQNGARVAIDGPQGGGQVVIRGGMMVMQNTSKITSSDSGGNPGGGISVSCDSLSLETGSMIETQALAAGAGGDISVSSSGPVSLASGGQLLASTESRGGAGNIQVQAQSLSIDGSAAPNTQTGIFSDCEAGASGNGGDIALNLSQPFSIVGGGTVAADTFSSGNAGGVTVQAASMTIDGSAALGHFTGISSSSDQGATGNGGDVDVTATDGISIQNGGAIVADTFSSGKAGEISVQALSLTISGVSALGYFTGIASDSDTGASNDGGGITLNVTGGISIEGGGTIAADTFSRETPVRSRCRPAP